MLNADTSTFQEFMAREKVKLSTIHDAVLEFLRGRQDIVVFRATAVNAYVKEPRMTQDIDLLALHAEALGRELRDFLNQRFHIDIRPRRVAHGRGFRLYQIQKSGNRHLVDIRQVESLPPARRLFQLSVIEPVDLIAGKVIAFHRRRGKPKSGTDWRDIAMLLLTFPALKTENSAVADRLKIYVRDNGAPEVLNVWKKIAKQDIQAENDEDEFL